MKKIVLTFGIIGGTIISVLMLTTISLMKNQIDYSLGTFLGYLNMIVALSMVFVGTRSYRDKHLGGVISFGKAFQVGILIAAIASLMYAVTWEVYYNLAAQDFMTQYTQHYMDQMKKDGASQAEIDQMLESMNNMSEMYKNPIIRFGMTLMEIVPVGVAITLISSLILKSNKPATA